MKKNFCNIEKLIKIARKGKIFVLVDDENRENEGDLVFLASKCTPRKINFMAKYGRGLICLALDKHQSDKLGLKLMSNSNGTRFSTAFTVSIEAKKGVTTGISAFDRSKTINVAIKKSSTKKDIVTPGHIFPLVAKKGGVLIRAGHTEASVDIAKISSNTLGAVICEIMNDDGSMAKRDQLFKFARKHRLQVAKIEDLIEYRLKKENFIKLISKSKLKFKNNIFDKKVFMNTVDKQNHLVISSFNLDSNNCRVRVLSLKDQVKKKNILQIDEVKKSLNYLHKYKSFALILIKDFAMKEYNSFLKFMSSKKELPVNFIRNYGVGAQIIKKLGINNLILVTKSKKRIVGLDGFGIKIKKQEIFK
tara:strand:+ start:14129 stop:15214 length:1086 start_codon:yes stop_codon:yes gene_type:complete